MTPEWYDSFFKRLDTWEAEGGRRDTAWSGPKPVIRKIKNIIHHSDYVNGHYATFEYEDETK